MVTTMRTLSKADIEQLGNVLNDGDFIAADQIETEDGFMLRQGDAGWLCDAVVYKYQPSLSDDCQYCGWNMCQSD